jgi:hypothetical protein
MESKRDVGLAALPGEIVSLIVDRLEPADAVKLAELTCRELRAECDLLSLWQRLSLEAGLSVERDGEAIAMPELKSAYSRHTLHQRGACIKCGAKGRGRTRSLVDASPLPGRHMHLCDWLVSSDPTPGPALVH